MLTLPMSNADYPTSRHRAGREMVFQVPWRASQYAESRSCRLPSQHRQDTGPAVVSRSVRLEPAAKVLAGGFVQARSAGRSHP